MNDLDWLQVVSFESARTCLQNAHLIEQASQYLSRGDPESALSIARSVLASGGEGFTPYAREVIADALDGLAVRCEELEDWEHALRWRKELINHEPSALLPRLLLAEDMIMIGDYHSAEQELWQLLSVCARSIEGWTWLARCALRRTHSLAQQQSADCKAALRDLIRFTRQSWQVLRKPKWIYYPSATVVRITVEELYEATFAALAWTGRVEQARHVIEAGIAVLGDDDGYLRRLRDSFSPRIQYHLGTSSLLSAIDHVLVRHLLELSRQCDAITDLVHNHDYKQAFARLSALPPNVDNLLGDWRAWSERWLLAHAAESAAHAKDIEAEIHYIARWHQLAPSEEFPLLRWGELISTRDHKGALRAFHRLLRRSPKYIEALLEVARVHYTRRRLRLARHFVVRAWQTLPSPDWCYYPSEAVVRDRLRKLFTLTQYLLAVNGHHEQTEQVRQMREALLGESVISHSS